MAHFATFQSIILEINMNLDVMNLIRTVIDQNNQSLSNSQCLTWIVEHLSAVIG